MAEDRREAAGPGEGGSVTHWIGALKGGDPGAAQPLWERYFDRLVRLARQKLVAQRRRGADEDEEDAALSAFDSFCAGASRGRFPQLSDREDLWRLLVVITARKASAQAQRRRAQKRGGDRARVAAGTAEDPDALVLEEVAGDEPTPEFAAMVAEQFEHLLGLLGEAARRYEVDPEELRRIALWRMEGYSVDEIAARLGCARRTVFRRLNCVREAWEHEVA